MQPSHFWKPLNHKKRQNFTPSFNGQIKTRLHCHLLFKMLIYVLSSHDIKSKAHSHYQWMFQSWGTKKRLTTYEWWIDMFPAH